MPQKCKWSRDQAALQARDPTLADLAGQGSPTHTADASAAAFYSPLRHSLRASTAALRQPARDAYANPDPWTQVTQPLPASEAGRDQGPIYGTYGVAPSSSVSGGGPSEATGGGPRAADPVHTLGWQGEGTAGTGSAPLQPAPGRLIAAPGLLAHASVPVEARPLS